jgi:undecaprenyl-diphosphatase
MNEIAKIILLAVIQGIAEFLPVSSSGHLVIGKAIFGFESPGAGMEVALHLGTVIAIIAFYRADLRDLISPIFSGGVEPRNKSLRSIGFLFLATLPAGIIGILFNCQIESLFSNPRFAGIMLIVTSAILATTLFIKGMKKPINMPRALAVGISQAIAILPGISRSGCTIAMGEAVGIERSEAARFSFFLAIIAILGAVVFELFKNRNLFRWEYSIGIAVSAIVGYVALKLLIKAVEANKLWIFAPYCLIVGIATLIFI